MLTPHELSNAAWGDVEPEPVPWRAGPWTLALRGDELADIAFRGALVARSIRAVVRDRDWNTVPVSVAGLRETADALDVDLVFEGYGADLRGTLHVTGAEGELSIGFDADNRRDFERCRIGVVVLHPPSLAGVPLEVGHPDGSVTATRFPGAVSPHQPAFDIARLVWTADGIRVEARFGGDVFEMEDQRNWTDASFKTYSTPLAEPFPVRVAAGTRVRQEVRLRCSGEPTFPTLSTVVRLEPVSAVVPQVLVGASTAEAVRTADGLAPQRLVELDLRDANWRAALERARAEVPEGSLDVRLIAASPADVDTALDALADLPVARLGVFSPGSHVTEPELWVALRDGAARRALTADLVGGARTHYTELNRELSRLPADIPALAFSITPQMHARERAQVAESIAMIRCVVMDAFVTGGGRPLHVGPITLRPRVNAVATLPPPVDGRSHVDAGYGAERVEGSTDPRQSSAAVAAWTIAAVAAAAVPGVASITLFESSGPRGLIDDAHPAGMPALAAIRAVTSLAGLPLLVARTSPAGVAVLGARDGVTTRVLAANLTPAPIDLACKLELDGEPRRLAMHLDAWGWGESTIETA